MDMAGGQGRAVFWKDRMVGEWVSVMGPARGEEKGGLEEVTERVEAVRSSGKEEATPAAISPIPCAGTGVGEVGLVEDNDAPRVGNDVGVIGPSTTFAAGSSPFAFGSRPFGSSSMRIAVFCPCLRGSPTVGGGVSLESISPISSIAPPSNSVSSAIETEDEYARVGVAPREGDRSGRAGVLLDAGEGTGEWGVWVMVGSWCCVLDGEMDVGEETLSFFSIADTQHDNSHMLPVWLNAAVQKPCEMSCAAATLGRRTAERWLLRWCAPRCIAECPLDGGLRRGQRGCGGQEGRCAAGALLPRGGHGCAEPVCLAGDRRAVVGGGVAAAAGARV